MTNITYYYSPTEEKTFQRLLKHSLYQPLIDYFLTHQEQRLILRQLKAHFTQEPEFDGFLDAMIKAGLIQRKNRCYQLAFPMFKSVQIQKLKQQAQQVSLSLDIRSVEEPEIFLGEMIWQLLFANSNPYFFGVLTAAGEQAPVFYQKKSLENERLSLHSVTSTQSPALTLPNYFWTLKNNPNDQIEVKYADLTNLLGDVHPDYFLQQTNRVVRKIQKQRKINVQKRNIFLESLAMTKVVAKRGECWQFNQPVVSATASPNIYNQHKQLLADIEQLLHQQTNSQIEQLIYRQFIFAELLNKIKAYQLNYLLIRIP